MCVQHDYVNPAHNAAHAIYADAEAAAGLLHASPLRFVLESVQAPETGEGDGDGDGEIGAEGPEPGDGSSSSSMARDITSRHRNAEEMIRSSSLLHSAPNSSTSTSSNHNHTPPPQVPVLKHFHLTATPSRLRHRDAVERHPFYGPFVIDTKSAIQRDLATRVPLLGLSEISMRRGSPPARILQKRAKERKAWRGVRDMVGEGAGRDRTMGQKGW